MEQISYTLPETFVGGFHDKNKVLKMPYSQLGCTKLYLSTLGLGGGAMSGFYDEFEDNEAIETVVDAVKNGINYIDTAPYYGQGRSEIVLGKALQKIPRKSYYISTKVGRYTKDWSTMFNYSPEKITCGLNNSLKLLGLDYVDIIVIHDIEFADLDEIVNVTLPAVEKLVVEGKARYIAISGYPVSTLWELVTKSKVKIDVVLTYSRDSLIDKTLHNYLNQFQAKGVGVINAAPTAMSLLTNIGPQSWHPASPRIKDICSKASEYCKKKNIELGKLSVFHTMNSCSGLNVLVGMNNRRTLNFNLSLITNGLTREEMEVLQYLQDNIFPKEENLHWEGVEIAEYKKHIKETSK